MICKKCGKKIKEGSKWCPNCGERIETEQPKKKKSSCLLYFLFAAAIIIYSGRNSEKMEEKEKQEKVEIERQTTSEQKEKVNAAAKETEIVKETEIAEVIANESEDPMTSRKYLKWYIAKKGSEDAKKYWEKAENLIAQSEELEENDIHLKTNQKWLKEDYFSITSEYTNYIYRGKLKDNKPSGFGILWKEYDSGFRLPVYCGNFSEGRFNGQGVLFAKYPEEAILVFRAPEEFSKMSLEKQQESLETIGYIGEFSDGKESGKGIRFDYPNLNQYFQLMAISNYEEASALDKKVNVYIGKFKKGEMNGSFKVYRDGFLWYDGDMEDDQKNGKGTLYYQGKKEIMYEGSWKDGKYDGKGTMYHVDGKSVKYKGSWKNGEYNGTGTLYGITGDVIYEGNWKDGDYAE